MTQVVSAIIESRATVLAAIVLVTVPYWVSGFEKLSNWPGAVDEMRRLGLPWPAAMAGMTVLLQLGGSAMILAGWNAWLGAGLLAGFTLVATLIGHPFWSAGDTAARARDRNSFMEHLGLIGALVLTAILRG